MEWTVTALLLTPLFLLFVYMLVRVAAAAWFKSKRQFYSTPQTKGP